ncbi:uncharacterized protein BJ171DRAFT_117404 [Polychytrium aggregatum]|uniref:uncharacterized protein n=1 Tax=Polychytrium aggregatum TaxID=110093 RepID=UPI0022FE8338|nr:uncharacterized protein BJ171DRAFT_117404 [Polychytrium aggregatum]KAI9209426.1 hypothetical protein BJ171DRAFT_117404 [Polychytrium aggregatum]
MSIQEFLDLLVGWSIDPALPPEISQLVSEFFRRVWPFWIVRIESAMNFMQQILSDIASHTNQLLEPQSEPTYMLDGGLNTNCKPIPETVLPFLRTFQSILQALSFATFPVVNKETQFDLSSSLYYQDYEHTVEVALDLIYNVGAEYGDRRWLKQGVELIKFMSTAMVGPLFRPFQTRALKFMFLEMDWFISQEEARLGLVSMTPKPVFDGPLDSRTIEEWLGQLEELIDIWSPNLDANLLWFFTRPLTSPLLNRIRIRCCMNASMMKSLLRLSKIVISVFGKHPYATNISQAYDPDPAPEELISEFLCIASIMRDDSQTHSLPDPYRDAADIWSVGVPADVEASLWKIEHSGLLALLIFDLSLVMEAVKWEIHGISKKSIMDLLFVSLDGWIRAEADHPGSPLWTKAVSSIFRALGETVKSQRFLLTAMKLPSGELKLILDDKPMPFIQLVRDAIAAFGKRQSEITMTAVGLLLDLMKELCKFPGFERNPSTQTETNRLCLLLWQSIELIMPLIDTERDPEKRLKIGSMVLLYVEQFQSPWFDAVLEPLGIGTQYRRQTFVRPVLNHIKDSDPHVRGTFLKLLARLSPSIPASDLILYGQMPSKFQAFKRKVMGTAHSGVFRSQHFSVVVSYLGMATHLQPSKDADQTPALLSIDPSGSLSDWLIKLFQSCNNDEIARQYPQASLDSSTFVEAISSDDNLMFWALWEAARYCILARLRTSFGGPKQTFEAIEFSLQNVHKATHEWIKLSDTEHGERAMDQLKLARHLLQFIDLLELQIENAIAGTSSQRLPPAPKASIAFFSANRKVCHDWFARIRKSVVALGQYLGSSELVIRHSSLLLTDRMGLLRRGNVRDLDAWSSDVSTRIVHLALAMSKLTDPDPIVGLVQWSRKVTYVPVDVTPKRTKEPDMKRLILAKKPTDAVESGSEPAGDAFVPVTGTVKIDVAWIEALGCISDARFETAIELLRARLKMMIQKGDLPSYHHEISVLIKQITNCYVALADYESMKQWLPILKEWRSEYVGTELASTFDTGYATEYLRSWWQLGRGDAPRVSQSRLSSAEVPTPVELLHGGLVKGTFNWAARQQTDALLLLHGASSDDSLVSSVLGLIDSAEKRVLAALQLVDLESPEQLSSAFLELQAIGALREMLGGCLGYSTDLVAHSESSHLSNLNRLGSLIHFAQSHHLDCAKGCTDVVLKIAKVARKSECHALSIKTLRRLEKLDAGMHIDQFDWIYQKAKTHFECGQVDEFLGSLAKLATWAASANVDTASKAPSILSKALLYLSQRTRSIDLESEVSSRLVENLVVICASPEISQKAGDLTTGAEHAHYRFAEYLATQSLIRAKDTNPASAKVWFAYSSYCYRLGRKLTEEVTAAHNKQFVFLEDEFKCILAHTAGGDEPVDTSTMRQVLAEIFLKDVEKSGMTGGSAGLDVAQAIETRLRQAFPSIDDSGVRAVIGIVLGIYKRILDHYENAVVGYFTYLRLNHDADSKTCPDDEVLHSGADAAGTSTNEYNVIVAALRILRLFVKFGAALEPVFRQGFADSPTAPWESVTPQLFSRLRHPEHLVRSLITDVLCRIGRDSPHLVIYHAVVGSLLAIRESSAADSSFIAIVSSLRKNGLSTLVSQVERMVSELQRITVLWEETWLHRLDQMQSDIAKRLQRYENELHRITHNKAASGRSRETALRDAYNIIMNPIFVELDHLGSSTIHAAASTDHERLFQQLYKDEIDRALMLIKAPSDVEKPQEAWTLFKKVHAKLGSELHRFRALKMHSISPLLAGRQGSMIPIPGIPIHGELITIERILEDVQVLNTKTKPKKITMVGSNGQYYTYLLKGHEDLHLDERVQQLLTITNQMLRHDNDSKRRRLHARGYSVIPFGHQHGMIQWVQNVMPVFAIYKGWFQRDHVATMLQNNQQPDADYKFPTTHGLYGERVRVALRKYKLPRNAPRGSWPRSLHRDVFKKLNSESSSMALSRELWCSSSSPAEWWTKTNSYARSLAVMSIVGYLIGLGDRHLDNILFDPSSGDVLHIDYNVCFEKGRKLRIPETVPFRLTQNFLSALGITGIEGTFRIACEHTMQVMRRNKEIILTLLEAFVYDPLVDWTSNLSDSVRKRVLEVNVHIGLIVLRLAELKPALDKDERQMMTTVRDIQRNLEGFIRRLNHRDDVTEKIEAYRQELRLSWSPDQQQADENETAAELAHQLEMYRDWKARHEAAMMNHEALDFQDLLEHCTAFAIIPFWSDQGSTDVEGLDPNQFNELSALQDQQISLVTDLTEAMQDIAGHWNAYQELVETIRDHLLKQDWFRLLASELEATLTGSAGTSMLLTTKYEDTVGESSHIVYTRRATLETTMKTSLRDAIASVDTLADRLTVLGRESDTLKETASEDLHGYLQSHPMEVFKKKFQCGSVLGLCDLSFMLHSQLAQSSGYMEKGALSGLKLSSIVTDLNDTFVDVMGKYVYRPQGAQTGFLVAHMITVFGSKIRVSWLFVQAAKRVAAKRIGSRSLEAADCAVQESRYQ